MQDGISDPNGNYGNMFAIWDHIFRTAKVTRQFPEKLGLITFGEGIENDMEAIGLRELGCQSGQGYYFARPMNREATMAWLQRWNYQLHNAYIRQRPSEEKMSIF